MKFFRHILSHIFLISVFLIIISVFYYRTFLLPQNLVDRIEVYVNEVYPPVLLFSSNRDYLWSRKDRSPVTFNDLFVKDEVVSEISGEQMLEKNVTISGADKNNLEKGVPNVDSEINILDNVEVKLKKSEDAVVTAVVTQETHSQEKDKKQVMGDNVLRDEYIQSDEGFPVGSRTDGMVQKNETQADSEKSSGNENIVAVISAYEVLLAARNSFNHGDMENAEKNYIRLTELDKSNPDVYGELGNVYYSQGKWEKAGESYYEAAVILISNGNKNQVTYLHRVIEGLNVEYADKLAQLMVSKIN